MLDRPDEQLDDETAAARRIPWRGGPQLDPEAEAAYRAEQADYE